MKQSAGILLYKQLHDSIQVLLVHPGGPFWKNKDFGSWSIPKGEIMENEDAFAAALREFEEETGAKLHGNFIPLQPVVLKSRKTIHAWGCERDFDVASVVSNEFEIEWPPHSGILKSFPEIDGAAWFTVDQALLKINPAQGDLITDLLTKI